MRNEINSLDTNTIYNFLSEINQRYTGNGGFFLYTFDVQVCLK